jgi:gas vesicle protein GvpK
VAVEDEIAELRRELERVRGILPDRVNVDPEGVEQGLAKLVLTLVEFLRQVLERQAIRRMDGGTLTDDEIERVGIALMRLQAKVREMAEAFGLDPNDLNLGLGPIGKLL